MRVLDGVWRALAIVAPTAVLLLGAAAALRRGDWLWPQALVFLSAFAAITVVANVALATSRPASFEVRARPYVAVKAGRQPLIDAIGLVAYLVFILAWLVFIPLDVFALHVLPPPPVWVANLGLALAVAGATVANLAVWQNRFAAPAIEDHAGQHVVDSGVYSLVRHPLYAGNLLLFAGTALWLGSVAACIATTAHLAATLARIRIEEANLRARLPAYEDYARRVRARLIPFVI